MLSLRLGGSNDGFIGSKDEQVETEDPLGVFPVGVQRRDTGEVLP